MKVDLVKKFPNEIFSIIELVGKIADRQGVPVYLVGGLVRDIFLRAANYDLDFVVEGHAIEFAEILNKALKGNLKKHQAFLTAIIVHVSSSPSPPRGIQSIFESIHFGQSAWGGKNLSPHFLHRVM